MSETTDDPVDRLASTDAPTERPTETLDARELPPPKPLKETLERLTELDDETVLVQVNDRAPQHLYPKLADRGYRYDTRRASEETAGESAADAPVVTAIWKP